MTTKTDTSLIEAAKEIAPIVEKYSADGAVVYVRGEIDGPVWDFYRFARNTGAMFSR